MQLSGSLSILWHYLSLELERKLTFSSPMTTAEFPKFAGILSAALSQHHLSGFETAQLEFHVPWMMGKAREFQKTSISALLTIPNPLTMWITINWRILKEIGIPDHLTCLLRNLYTDHKETIRTGHGTTEWFQIGKEYIKAIYCHPAYLTSMQSTS